MRARAIIQKAKLVHGDLKVIHEHFACMRQNVRLSTDTTPDNLNSFSPLFLCFSPDTQTRTNDQSSFIIIRLL